LLVVSATSPNNKKQMDELSIKSVKLFSGLILVHAGFMSYFGKVLQGREVVSVDYDGSCRLLKLSWGQTRLR
jgi:hypothetical protein